MSSTADTRTATEFIHGPKPVIGLIGAIGAGKSTVARRLATHGGFVINADQLGHEALTHPPIVAELVARWGPAIQKPDGTLDRRAISQIVFRDTEELQELESNVFPYIRTRTLESIDVGMRNAAIPYVVLDAAVLLEAGWGEFVDRIVYVDAPRDLRLQRLTQRSGWTDADLTNREAAQWPRDRKLAHAQAVIVNDADPATLEERVDQLLHDWKLACL